MKKIILIILFVPVFISCEKLIFEDEIQTDDPFTNFDYLWNECDKKYSFFEYKNIDWDSIRQKYRPALYKDMTGDSLFRVMGAMLKELRDDHTNLISDLNISYYGNYKTGQDNFSWRIIVDHYLPEDYYTSGPFRHDFILNQHDSIGYIRLPAFTGGISKTNLDFIMNRYKDTRGLIVDIRENGGGSISDIYKILSRFVNEKSLLYYSKIKNGPGHNDFSSKKAVYIEPADASIYNQKVIFLADRGSYSASSFTCLAARSLPNIIFMGDTTGGGLGIPNGGQLPNGWRYRFSITQTIDPDGNNFESGIPPEIHILFNWNDLSKDEVIEKAIQEINKPD
ncbi:MAG: S41 family peptidase [Bacteroidales bacterium]|nr:S41 family peptidase [Bacteroidales bacterium]